MADEESRNKTFAETQLVTFTLGEEEYGVHIMQVQEIIKFKEMTKVPRSPDFVKGVIDLRGTVIAVIDLREKFGLLQRPVDKHTRIIIVESTSPEGQKSVLGLIVDRVNEVRRVHNSQIDPPPGIVAGISSEFLKGVARLDESGKHLLIIIDLDKVLSTHEVIRLQNFQGQGEPVAAG